MGLPKGKTNNPSGRKIGSKNKTSAEIKETIQKFISANADTLQVTFNKLEPKDKAMFFERMLKYVIPTQTKAEVDISNSTMDNITFVIKGREK